jgi:hypothetical protein
VSAELHPYSSLHSSLPTTLPEAQALIGQLQQKLQWSELQRSALEEQLRLRRIEKYGAGSEKLSNLQLELLGGRTQRQPGGLPVREYLSAVPPGLASRQLQAPTRPKTHGLGRPALIVE